MVHSDYNEFLKTKTRRANPSGFEVSDSDLSSKLFPFQRDLVRWALRIGRAGLFADIGLGKTIMQLEWSRCVSQETGKPVIIVAPLAVSTQTQREGAKFGIPTTICKEDRDVRPGINITNYERLERFNAEQFGGCALDENLLKSYMGKTKMLLVDMFKSTKFKLSCTATPAPNDHLELGNQSEWLGIMPSNEMIARWFANDTMKMCSYKLKPHAEKDFWRWLSSWAVCVSNPADLGHDGSAYVLPPLDIQVIELNSENCKPPEGYLFHTLNVNATTMHKVKRSTAPERARAVADLVLSDPESDEPWVLWCDTNYEADELRPLIPGCVEIRGSDSPEKKEKRLIDFLDGSIQYLLTKADICGHGLNMQRCNRTALIGTSFSFERYIQLIGRFHRFGQLREVKVRIFSTDAESSVLKAVQAKESSYRETKAALIHAVRDDQLESIYGNRHLSEGAGRVQITVPSWLRSKNGNVNKEFLG